MPTKVLVFESDAAFAGELRTELGRLGMVAQVVDDGYAGLMAAASERPDLILLSIELPRMNGFSVCNKLKKDPALKDVPLIIMSSDSSEETFDQHRKLRTRAEDYVRKPIAFGELLEHMRPFVKVENGRPPRAATKMRSSSTTRSSSMAWRQRRREAAAEETTEVSSAANVEAEVEAFANTAFDRLMDSEPPTSTRSSRAPKAEDPSGRARTGSTRAPKRAERRARGAAPSKVSSAAAAAPSRRRSRASARGDRAAEGRAGCAWSASSRRARRDHAARRGRAAGRRIRRAGDEAAARARRAQAEGGVGRQGGRRFQPRIPRSCARG